MSNLSCLAVLITILSISCHSQNNVETASTGKFPELTFHVNANVVNADDDAEKEIVSLWQDYWQSREFQQSNGRHWSNRMQPISDQFLFELQLFLTRPSDRKIQNSIIGIYPAQHGHYALKSMFASVDNPENQIKMGYIISVYAREEEGSYKLVSSAEYHRLILDKRQVGNVTYYIHPAHKFDQQQAQKMDEFNQSLADKYQIRAIAFDYFVANYTRDISEIIGFDYSPKKYMPDQYGGMAETFNNTLFAGNNSEYYPHEVVHLYNHTKYPRQHHHWVDEGIATFFGGSTGMSLDWHLGKLKSFLQDVPDYDLSQLDALRIDIPNGEHMTEFRYVIGGLMAKMIFEKEGMQGLFDMLQSGRSEDDYINLLKTKLGVSKEGFDAFVKEQLRLIK